MWTGGPDTTRTWFNDAWLAFVRRPLEREVGTGWIEHVHTDDAARVTNAYVGAVARREPFEIEYRLRRYDGQYRIVLESARPSTGGTYSEVLKASSRHTSS